MRLQIKVCGMTDGNNIRQVEELGVDFIGFVFHAASPRYIHKLPSYLPRRAQRVGVFVDHTQKEVEQMVSRFGLNAIQLHGHESPAYCRHLRSSLGLTIIKAFHLSDPDDLKIAQAYEGLCDYYLFEPQTEQPGGSGRGFDWDWLANYNGPTPFLLSGGIGPDSLESLSRFHHPCLQGIDLNSRFEQIPGLKDIERLKKFIQELPSTFKASGQGTII